MYLGGDEQLTSLEWLQSHVALNHGGLGNIYPLKTWTVPNPHGAMKEGDTPAWFFFLNNGLNVPEQPALGGWGGRFVLNDDGYYSDAVDSFMNVKSARATVYRWRADFQNDWAARMDWSKEELVFYFDGKEIRREKNQFGHSPAPVWLSLAIIPWAGKITDAINGTKMEVDYVRIYKRK